MATLATPTPPKQSTSLMTGWDRTANQAAERYVLAAAGAVIVALTAGGFWLSYAHLAEVAGQHGLGSSPVRQWAWPATLDAFIVAGELLMLRAGLRRIPDWWAIALTAIGSFGSITLNVAGVSGTGKGTAAPLLDYIVAAVPPTAALLAFGVLMRQIHQLVAQPAHTATTEPEPNGSTQPTPCNTAAPEPDPAPTAPSPDSTGADGEPVGRGTGTPADEPPRQNIPDTETTKETKEAEGTDGKRTGRPAGATMTQLLAVARPAVAQNGVSRSVVERAVRGAGLPLGSTRFTELMRRLRAEQAHPQQANTQPSTDPA